MKRRSILTGGLGMLALGPFILHRGAAAAMVSTFKLSVFGTTVRILIREDESKVAIRQVRMAATRFLLRTHSKFTLFADSPLQQLNSESVSEPVEVDADILELTRLGVLLSRETEGRFDPALGGLTSLFRVEENPDTAKIQQVRLGAGIDNVNLQGDRIGFHNPHTSLDFNALVKGWAVDRLAEILEDRGIRNFLINAGGDLRAKGTQGDRDGWIVQIQNPTPGAEPLHKMIIKDQAVATSGNTKQPFPHLVDGRIASSVDTLISSTAIAKTTASADAWATAAFVGGLGWSRAVNCGHELILVDKKSNLHQI